MDYLHILAEQAGRASSESEEPLEAAPAEPDADGGTSANGRRVRKRRMLDGEPVELPVSRPKDKDERIKARNRRAQQRWRDKQKARLCPAVQTLRFIDLAAYGAAALVLSEGRLKLAVLT